jgi:hypothetical protein
MRFALAAVALLLCAAAPVSDPDWPCVQRLVPTLSASSLWAGPPPAADWKADADVASLVDETAPRDVPVEDAAGKLQAFAQAHPEQAGEAFAGLADRINAQRSEVIDHLREIGRRQRDLADRASRSTVELHALPADAAPEQRQEVVDRRALLIREYQSIDRTLQYACDVPVQLERRLGRFAQVLQAAGQ